MKKPPSTRTLSLLLMGVGWLVAAPVMAADQRGDLTRKVSLEPAPATAADTQLTRADLVRMFKARCPGRVERLLGTALPSERPDFTAIAEICSCAGISVEAALQGSSMAQYQSLATEAAMACSKTTVISRNEQRARKALTPYLVAQGLDASQIGHFTQCAASTHWQDTIAGSGQPPAAYAWWIPCSEHIGRKGLALPDAARD